MKALGTGASRGVTWTSIEVGHAPGGRPVIRLHGAAAQMAEQACVRHISLSVTHTESQAMAMVIFED
jgi:holo-[acyl-carrier protein] synthase